MDKQLINTAAKSLALVDIALLEQSLKTNQDDYYLGELKAQDYTQQHMLNVTKTLLSYSNEEREFNTLAVRVKLGVRLVEFEGGESGKDLQDVEDVEGGAEEIKRVYAEITADYLAEYLIVGDIPPMEALDEFSNFNAIHNVYPFWREMVFSTAKNARLPKIFISLYHDSGPAETAGGVEISRATNLEGSARKTRRRSSKKKAKANS